MPPNGSNKNLLPCWVCYTVLVGLVITLKSTRKCCHRYYASVISCHVKNYVIADVFTYLTFLPLRKRSYYSNWSCSLQIITTAWDNPSCDTFKLSVIWVVRQHVKHTRMLSMRWYQTICLSSEYSVLFVQIPTIQSIKKNPPTLALF